MRKNEKIQKGIVPAEKQTCAYNVRKRSFLAFFCVCIIALTLVMQIFAYKRTVSKRMLCETVMQRAGVFEEIILNAEESLKNVRDEIKLSHTGKEDMFFVNSGRLFKSVRLVSKDVVFGDDSDFDESGFFPEEDYLNMYLCMDNDNVLIAELDMAVLQDLSRTSGSYDGKAEHILFDKSSGKILANSAERYGSDGSRIGFLADYDFEEADGVNSRLSQIPQSGTGYSVIKNEKGEPYSFAYAPVGDEGWYLVQFLPEKELKKSVFIGTTPYFACIILLIAGALVLTLWVSRIAKRIASDRAVENYNTKIMRTLIAQVAESGFAYMFVYYRDTDEITIYRDREGVHPDGIEKKDALSYLATYYGHTDSDMRRLKNSIALAGPQKTIKLDLVCTNRENTILEYTLCCVKNEFTDRKDSVVFTVIERTDASEQNNTATLQVPEDNIYNTTGIEVMLERNKWRFLWNNEDCLAALNFGTDVRNNYDLDVEREIAPFIQSKDRQRFLTTLSRLNLLENYRNGTTDVCIRYKINTGGGIYELRVLDIHMYRDVKNDEIKANMYARHVGRV